MVPRHNSVGLGARESDGGQQEGGGLQSSLQDVRLKQQPGKALPHLPPGCSAGLPQPAHFITSCFVLSSRHRVQKAPESGSHGSSSSYQAPSLACLVSLSQSLEAMGQALM